MLLQSSNNFVNKTMQGINDPQAFELSEVVKKSSKTGVFKNQRLLMIKDGFLYYFSNVPSDYKPNETNVMSSLKQFPKCSIEIRSIQNIKLESAKSTTLIIIFHDKDMIDREDIRKSLSSKNYNHPVKQDSSELIEWSFIFDTVTKCRLWYASLLKLKQYFVKNADKFDKFAQYMANFDPQIRSSLPQFTNRNSESRKSANQNKPSPIPSPKSNSNSAISQSKYKMDKPGIFQIQESNEQYDDQITPKSQTKQIREKPKPKIEKEEQKLDEIKPEPINKAANESNSKLQVKKEEPPKTTISQPQKLQQAQIFQSIMQSSLLKEQPKPAKNESKNNPAVTNTNNISPSFVNSPKINPSSPTNNFSNIKNTDSVKSGNIANNTNTAVNIENNTSKRNNTIPQENPIKPQLFQNFSPEKQDKKKPNEQQNIIKPNTIQNQRSKKIQSQDPKKHQKKQQSLQIQKIIEEKARKADQQREKAEQKALKYRKQLEDKQEMIRKMAEQIQSNKKAQQMLQQKILQQKYKRQQEQQMRIRMQRQKRQEQEYKRLNESIKLQPVTPDRSSKELNIRESSKQTEFERDFIEVIENGFKTNSANKANRFSIKSEFSLNPLSNERQTLNLFRNTISYISEVRIQNAGEVQQFDYFWEIGQVYKSALLKQRIVKELQLAQFIKKASQKATSLITQYIDMNKPKESLKIQRNLFQIQIVCDKGKLIRTEGSERLVYPNENHQRLKRFFKIYNQLNQVVLTVLKKKPNCPLRVPFACLVQYKGYTALAKIVPPLRENTINSQHLRLLGPNIPLYNLVLNDFQAHGQIFTIIQPTLAFKVSKQDETSIVRLTQRNIDFLSTNRKANISICSKKLFEQAKEIEGSSKERFKLAEMTSFCRELKKYMKALTPYQDQNEFQFFEDFLKNPRAFMERVQIQESKVTGILIYYIEKLLGIKLKQKLSSSEPQYTTIPIKRTFNLSSLDVNHFAINFEKYLFEKKYQIAQKALSYFKQIQQDYSQTLMRQVTLHIHQKQFNETLEKLELAQELMSIHDPRRLKIIELQAQCHEALGDIGSALSALKLLLQQTQYMYGKQGKHVVDIYFLIADLLSRQKLIPELIQVYRKIIQENPDYRHKVLIDFSTNLLNQENTDPHILLDFLQKQIPESIEQNHPQIQQLLGQLYFKVKNKPKALVYFTNAIHNLINEDRKFTKISQIFIRVIECCSTLKEKKTVHRQILSKMNTLNYRQSQQCKRINTYICCVVSQALQQSERDGLIMFLQYHKGSGPLKLLEWSWIETCLGKISKGEKTTLQQRNILISSINTNSLSQTLILLNNPNFI